ncbi:24537_t:CDS:2 [Cetraspora pellucida]|uniref:24537_t:CDS:1 n=1 Tax=Cetraspora pellucida TaxID=1433469 RepID=A0A9N9DVS7_9GLOM|nr:24537_t:CDS:2 [Cetraspora pellucida]
MLEQLPNNLQVYYNQEIEDVRYNPDIISVNYNRNMIVKRLNTIKQIFNLMYQVFLEAKSILEAKELYLTWNQYIENNFQDNEFLKYQTNTAHYLAILFAEWINVNVQLGTNIDLLNDILESIVVSFIPKTDIQLNIPETKTPLSLLFSPFKIDLYLTQICEEQLAKKKDLTIENVLVNPSDLIYYKFKEKIISIVNYSIVILCDNRCTFNNHVITMCRRFAKDEKKVCILSKGTNKNIIYNTANLYANLEDGGTGYSVFFTNGFIKIAYTLNYQNYLSMQMMTQHLKTELTDAVKEFIKAKNKKINQSNFQEYLYIALYGSTKTLINEQKFKNIFINKLFLNNEKQESNNNENLLNDLNNNEQQLPNEENQNKKISKNQN